MTVEGVIYEGKRNLKWGAGQEMVMRREKQIRFLSHMKSRFNSVCAHDMEAERQQFVRRKRPMGGGREKNVSKELRCVCARARARVCTCA